MGMVLKPFEQGVKPRKDFGVWIKENFHFVSNNDISEADVDFFMRNIKAQNNKY